jgi:hypothetical protein
MRYAHGSTRVDRRCGVVYGVVYGNDRNTRNVGNPMSIHAVSYYEKPDCLELVDVAYQCSWQCMDAQLQEDGIHTADIAGERNTDEGSMSWGAWPCGSETDYDVYCSQCETLLWHGLDYYYPPDRFDIAEAFSVWVHDYADTSDPYWCAKQAQLSRIKFSPRPSLRHSTLSGPARAAYDRIVEAHS